MFICFYVCESCFYVCFCDFSETFKNVLTGVTSAVLPWHRMLGLRLSICPSVDRVWSLQSLPHIYLKYHPPGQVWVAVFHLKKRPVSFSQILWIMLLTRSLPCQKDQIHVWGPPIASMPDFKACAPILWLALFFSLCLCYNSVMSFLYIFASCLKFSLEV